MKFKYLFCCMLLSFCMQLFAANDTSQSIKEIDRSIKKIQKQLSKDNNQRKQLENVLKQTEVTMGELDKQLYDINQQLKKENTVLTSLKNKQSTYKQQLQSQQLAIADEVNTLYYLQSDNYLQTLLNQTDTSNFSRNVMYFKYFNQSRLESMQEVKQTLIQIQQNQTNIEKQTKTLNNMLQDKLQRQQKLKQLSTTRNTVLIKLDQQISSRQQRLIALQNDKTRLEELFNQLGYQQNIPVQPPLPFTSMAGKLHWPTKGKISEHYDETIGNSELKSSGVLIDAPTGQNVYAIYPGKIVFADWLKGFGLLMIVDHGNGYMTLYARNNAIFYHVGDFVNKGDIIAQVGQTGGYPESGLYFEIRKDGNPINPEQWCV